MEYCLLFWFTYYILGLTGHGNSISRVSAPGNGREAVGSITGRNIPKLLKMVLAAPRLALWLMGQS